MSDFFASLLESNSTPWITALALGFMTAISPCPLATNITAIGFISKDISDRNRIFLNGILYTLGRIITYTSIALVIYLGADQLKLSGFFQRYGEKIIGPILIIIGLFMLGIVKINIPGISKIASRMEEKKSWNYPDAILLGIIFALAFCPYSGVLYFGMLIPLSVASAQGLFLPVIFAVATGIPVIIVSWILAYSVAGIGKFYNNIRTFEIWFRRFTAVVFIAVGVYYFLKITF